MLGYGYLTSMVSEQSDVQGKIEQFWKSGNVTLLLNPDSEWEVKNLVYRDKYPINWFEWKNKSEIDSTFQKWNVKLCIAGDIFGSSTPSKDWGDSMDVNGMFFNW
jgi:hypothetical protein